MLGAMLVCASAILMPFLDLWAQSRSFASGGSRIALHQANSV